MDANKLEILAGQIATGGVIKRTADQLACIVRLIFYNGIRKSAIIELEVRDVIDSKDNILQRIEDLNVIISGNSAAALRDYLRTPKDRKPHLLKRGAHLFPGYRNTKKLDRDLKAVGAEYIDLIRSGVRHSYSEFMGKGVERIQALEAVVELFPYDVKTVQNIVAGKTAPAGARDDDRTRVVELSEKASNIKLAGPEALEKAVKVISELEMMYKQAEDGEWKDQLEGIIRSTREILEPIFSAKQKTDAETPDNDKSEIQPPDLLKRIRSINSNFMRKISLDIDDEDHDN
jgi:hypothetical protein